ncbi:hypothetical protein [Rubritalea tangerina]|uniref:hypothetical protein n=1 Tax=Rubritalea tangerina TaxID=430798 RepID=UPI003609827E
MEILAYLASAGTFVCWIMALIKMFQNDKLILAILGILCPLWAYIWGWMNKDKMPHSSFMIIWTIFWILGGISSRSLG